MMISNLKYKAIAILGLFIMASCSDYLEEENLGNTTAENYYDTRAGYENLVNAAYATLRDIYEPTPYVFSAGTDLFFATHPEVPSGLASYQTLTPSNSEVEDLFRTTYQSIQITNLALDYAGKTESFEELDTRVAELKSLRAYYYFLLVQHFGDVSLVTQLIDEPITHFDRDPASEVYQFIIDQLEGAIPVLPEQQSDFGRINKRAAQHILAKVYLTRGYEDFAMASDFSRAASLADDAINNQNLNVTFSELFAYENDSNEEVLWSVQYSSNSTLNGGAHNWDYPWGPLVQGSDDGVNKKNALHPTEYLLTLFDANDSRFEGTFLNIKTTPYSGWRIDPDNTRVQYYYPRTQEEIDNVEAWRAENPETRSATIISPIGPHWWDPLNQTDFPALKKYDRVQLSNPSIQYTHDLYLARLGETYLIAAEAYLQANNTSEAIGRINTVRQRAGADPINSVNLDLILAERARELAGEGFRWMDLKRTGKLMEYTKERNPDIRSLVQSGTDPFMGPDGNAKILRPIPLSAIALDDGVYPQNPGY